VRERGEGSGVCISYGKSGEFCAEAALGVETSNNIKSSVSRGKESSTANLRKKCYDT